MRTRCTALVAALALAAGSARADTIATDLSGEARSLLDVWLKAQNEGDFDTYQIVYAQRFTGVRRSGPRTVRLDRAGWLKDRKRMFGKPMAVSISGLTI